MILNIDTVSRYVTQDGTEFENKTDAQRHATKLQVEADAAEFVTRKLGYTKSHHSGAVNAIVAWTIEQNFGRDAEQSEPSDDEPEAQAELQEAA